MYKVSSSGALSTCIVEEAGKQDTPSIILYQYVTPLTVICQVSAHRRLRFSAENWGVGANASYRALTKEH